MNEDYLQRFEHGITAIDTGYVRPKLDASHLIVRNGRAAFVDTGTTHSVPRLMSALAALSLKPADVDYILLTHIHLDHAGGAGALVQELPQARVVVHPRGHRHIVDPEKLITGTMAVYGEAAFKRLYGEIRPVRDARVMEAQDGARLRLGDSTLELIHTPGHALHHYCIVDSDSKGIFSGDTFGISYRIFDTEKGAFIFPTTTPVHFDPEQLHASIDRLMSYQPEAMYLTHYSRVTELDRLSKELHAGIDALTNIARKHLESTDRADRIKTEMHAWINARLDEHGCRLDQATRDLWLEMDIDLNAKGLDHWLNRISAG